MYFKCLNFVLINYHLKGPVAQGRFFIYFAKKFVNADARRVRPECFSLTKFSQPLSLSHTWGKSWASCLARNREAISWAVSWSVRLSFCENFASRGEISNIMTDIFLTASRGENLTKTEPHTWWNSRSAQLFPRVCGRLYQTTKKPRPKIGEPSEHADFLSDDALACFVCLQNPLAQNLIHFTA